jgi:hypothetical protein
MQITTTDFPSTLYKYYEIKDFLAKVFNGETLKFTCPLELNDPFESYSCYQIENTAEGKKYISEMVKQNHSNPTKRITETKRLKEKLSSPHPIGDEIFFQNILRQIGICCFSEVKDSILMWSHYAKKHSGICVGFETNKSLFQLAWPVKYQDEFPVVIRPADSDEILLRKTLLTKAKCWDYEKEWRITQRTVTKQEQQYRIQSGRFSPEFIKLFVNEHGPGYYNFSKDSIAVVYLGVRIEQADRDKVIQWIKDANLNIPIYAAQKSPKKYSLEFILINSKH